VFKREVQHIKEQVLKNLRQQGLETPLLQKRLMDSWPLVVGEAISRYTLNTYIQNQTLCVRLSSPALRADLSMRRKELVALLNSHVGSLVITDIRFC
jgi:predicted nucleic acid-binding Zn ribbon protein